MSKAVTKETRDQWCVLSLRKEGLADWHGQEPVKCFQHSTTQSFCLLQHPCEKGIVSKLFLWKEHNSQFIIIL